MSFNDCNLIIAALAAWASTLAVGRRQLCSRRYLAVSRQSKTDNRFDARFKSRRLLLLSVACNFMRCRNRMRIMSSRGVASSRGWNLAAAKASIVTLTQQLKQAQPHLQSRVRLLFLSFFSIQFMTFCQFWTYALVLQLMFGYRYTARS